MAKRVIKTVYDARAFLAEAVPEGIEVYVTYRATDRRDQYGQRSTTQYEAYVYDAGFSKRLSVEAHTAELLVTRFCEQILPRLGAAPEPATKPRAAKRVSGGTTLRLGFHG